LPTALFELGLRTATDGQDLWEVGGLPCDATQMMRLDEIEALLRPIASKWRSSLSSKSGLPDADGLIMDCAPPQDV